MGVTRLGSSSGRCPRVAAVVVAAGLAFIAPRTAAATSRSLKTSNNTPFATSTVITGASWTSARYSPPANQFGDILSTSSVDKGSLYVLMDDGGTGTSGGALWRNSLAEVTGSPGKLEFRRVGSSAPPATWAQIAGDKQLWTGTLGSYYSMGFTDIKHVFYATQANDWNWSANGPFQGLAGIAYSTDEGKHWHYSSKPFPGPTGNLNWVQYGADAAAPDGYVYALATEREFNASTLVLGRAKADIADIIDPARWQWAAGTDAVGGRQNPIWSSSISRAKPILTWNDHITYPRMSYDPALHRYLLTFTYSYAGAPPAVWKNGSELVILESSEPWGPFSFVARDPYFGPSNGYDPAFPANWISSNGVELWMIWAANFDGCAPGLLCSGAYGFNYQRLRLTAGGPRATTTQTARSHSQNRANPPSSKGSPPVPAGPPRYRRPRLYVAPARPETPALADEPPAAA
jgi:hypothetical protein